jgi:hypothetical protein
MSSTSIVTDIIVILDESGSMLVMGSEPVHSVNSIFVEQKNKQKFDDGATATLVTFNDKSVRVIDSEKFSELKELTMKDYNPEGKTMLNDTICNTIKTKLDSSKPHNVILMIITDGEENASITYSRDDVKRMIKLAEDNYDWKVIFIGANIDVFSSGNKMNIGSNRCAEFNQMVSGSLLTLCRSTSICVENYRRCRSEGSCDSDLTIPYNNRVCTTTEPPSKKQICEDLNGELWPLAIERQRATSITHFN